MTDKRLGAASAMASVQTLDDRVPVVLKVVDKLRKSPFLPFPSCFSSIKSQKRIKETKSFSLTALRITPE